MPAPADALPSCSVSGCTSRVSKPGFTLCYPHWKAERAAGRKATAAAPAKPATPTPDVTEPRATLSATKLGAHFGLSSQRINLVLAELGWLEKYVKGWTPTDQGNRVGAEVRTSSRGIPYALWPESVLDHKALKVAVQEITGVDEGATTVEANPRTVADSEPEAARSADSSGKLEEDTPIGETDAFRRKFPASYRTQDGHMVRSRAEAMIDDYLYQNRIVHAYERRLPIEEDALCDFYLPEQKVYIEFWGMESDPKYAARQRAKQAIYEKYGFHLVELADADVQSLDDTLPRKLLAFGVECS